MMRVGVAQDNVMVGGYWLAPRGRDFLVATLAAEDGPGAVAIRRSGCEVVSAVSLDAKGDVLAVSQSASGVAVKLSGSSAGALEDGCSRAARSRCRTLP